MTNLERLALKRKVKRKKRIRATVAVLLIVTILAGAVLGIILYKNGGKLPSKPLNLKTTEAPQYVDIQLLNIGLARTGVKLVEINNIVIHYVGNPDSTAQNNRDYFNKIDTEVCSHFVIGLDGEIIQCVPLDEKSNASNNRNLDTISIEVCHPDDSGKFTDVTYASLVKLTAWLCDNSRLKASDVIRHYDITGKECPKYFVTNEAEWKKFLEDVKTELKKY
ncbi:MAG: N-acetylmuramoyl-L-alanine amidase [Ruminococcaceae bacterium]|nr:N-acetylmuramoyl-L-alanine amidase [Oscillospiraceae bacterium]